MIKGLKCSFCHKHQKDVGTMIAGPDVNICDGCVIVCAQMIRGGSQGFDFAEMVGEAESKRLVREIVKGLPRGATVAQLLNALNTKDTQRERLRKRLEQLRKEMATVEAEIVTLSPPSKEDGS